MMNQMEMTLHTFGKSFLKHIHGIVLGCTRKVMEDIGEVKKRDQESKAWPGQRVAFLVCHFSKPGKLLHRVGVGVKTNT